MRGQRNEIYIGQMGDKRFGDEGGAKVQHQSRGGQIVQWTYTCRRSSRKESQCDGMRGSSKSESCQEL